MTTSDKKPSLTYKDAGVDIDAGEDLVKAIKPLAKSTLRPEVLTGLGGFGALFQIPMNKYREPVLVSGTDGVGTKLKLAIELGKHDSIGIDLVAMCVNDIIVQGAEPLFFLDYFATGKLNIEHGTDVISGIAEGCRQAGCALIGGETAEMPGMYAGDDYDLAGFSVGIVEKSDVITGEKVTENDILLGLAATGLHSNGYSLARKIIEVSGADLNDNFNGAPVNTDQKTSLGETLLTPTRIYVKSILAALTMAPIKAIAHITGGGLTDNVPRVMPKNTCAKIDRDSWSRPAIFNWLQDQGNIDEDEMLRTFNCGIGMVLIVDAGNADKIQASLTQSGETVFRIGRITRHKGSPIVDMTT